MSDRFLSGLGGSDKDEEDDEAEEGKVDVVKTLEDTLERREEQIADLKERVNELEEELENKETSPTIIQSNDGVEIPAGGLVSLRETLSRAVDMEVTPQNQASLASGLEATRSQLDALFEELGVERIDPDTGDAFDERYYRAVGGLDDGGSERTVADVERVGFEYDGTVIRRADVVVNSPRPPVEELEE